MQASTLNTDGIDTFYSSDIVFRNMTVDCGDDFVAPKANSSNILIQDSHFYHGTGVAIGSIGQYLGEYEYIENVLAERITCTQCEYTGWIKTWTGIQQGYPPNGKSYFSALIWQVLTLLGGFKEVVADWDTPETSVSPTRLNL